MSPNISVLMSQKDIYNFLTKTRQVFYLFLVSSTTMFVVKQNSLTGLMIFPHADRHLAPGFSPHRFSNMKTLYRDCKPA